MKKSFKSKKLSPFRSVKFWIGVMILGVISVWATTAINPSLSPFQPLSINVSGTCETRRTTCTRQTTGDKVCTDHTYNCGDGSSKSSTTIVDKNAKPGDDPKYVYNVDKKVNNDGTTTTTETRKKKDKEDKDYKELSRVVTKQKVKTKEVISDIRTGDISLGAKKGGEKILKSTKPEDQCSEAKGKWNGTACEMDVTNRSYPTTKTTSANCQGGSSCPGASSSIGGCQWAQTGGSMTGEQDGSHACVQCGGARKDGKGGPGIWGDVAEQCGEGNAKNYITRPDQTDAPKACWKDGTWFANVAGQIGDEMCVDGSWKTNISDKNSACDKANKGSVYDSNTKACSTPTPPGGNLPGGLTPEQIATVVSECAKQGKSINTTKDGCGDQKCGSGWVLDGSTCKKPASMVGPLLAKAIDSCESKNTVGGKSNKTFDVNTGNCVAYTAAFVKANECKSGELPVPGAKDGSKMFVTCGSPGKGGDVYKFCTGGTFDKDGKCTLTPSTSSSLENDPDAGKTIDVPRDPSNVGTEVNPPQDGGQTVATLDKCGKVGGERNPYTSGFLCNNSDGSKFNLELARQERPLSPNKDTGKSEIQLQFEEIRAGNPDAFLDAGTGAYGLYHTKQYCIDKNLDCVDTGHGVTYRFIEAKEIQNMYTLEKDKIEAYKLSQLILERDSSAFSKNILFTQGYHSKNDCEVLKLVCVKVTSGLKWTYQDVDTIKAKAKQMGITVQSESSLNTTPLAKPATPPIAEVQDTGQQGGFNLSNNPAGNTAVSNSSGTSGGSNGGSSGGGKVASPVEQTKTLSVAMQTSNSNFVIAQGSCNDKPTTIYLGNLGCGPATAYNIVKNTIGTSDSLTQAVDKFDDSLMGCGGTGVDAVITELQRDYGFTSIDRATGKILYPIDRRNMATELLQYTSSGAKVVVSSGVQQGSGEEIEHINYIDSCKKKSGETTCVVVDSYFSGGNAMECKVNSDNLDCSDPQGRSQGFVMNLKDINKSNVQSLLYATYPPGVKL